MTDTPFGKEFFKYFLSMGVIATGASLRNTYVFYIKTVALYKKLSESGNMSEKKLAFLKKFVKDAPFGCKRIGSEMALRDIEKYETRLKKWNAKQKIK